MFKKILERFWELFFTSEFISYVGVGAFATIVDWTFVYIFTDFFGLWYVLSVVIGYIGGSLTNYLLNKKYTFKNTSMKIGHQFLIFHLITGMGFFLNLEIVVFLVEYLNVWYMFAKMISTSILLLWNFLGHKYITFKIV